MDFPGIAHVGWKSVHEAIGSFHEDGEFDSRGVRAFVRQYLALVERWFHPEGAKGFQTLLDDYGSILKKMRRILEEDDDGVGGMVPEDRTDYRDALVRLVKESRQNPKQLRRAVAAYLKGRGCKTWSSHNPKLTHYWLTWTDTNLTQTARSLGGEDGFLRWGMTFKHHVVRVRFHLYKQSEEVSPWWTGSDVSYKRHRSTGGGRANTSCRTAALAGMRFRPRASVQGRACRAVRIRGQGRSAPETEGLHGFGRVGVRTH